MTAPKMVYLEGSRAAFRCDCGGNVFRSDEQDSADVFTCNGCGSKWKSELVSGATLSCDWCQKVVPAEAVGVVHGKPHGEEWPRSDRVCRPCVNEFLEAVVQ